MAKQGFLSVLILCELATDSERGKKTPTNLNKEDSVIEKEIRSKVVICEV